MSKILYNNFQNKFITLINLKLPELPQELNIEGDKYVQKSEFHITLLAVEEAAKNINESIVEDLKVQIVKNFYDFVEQSSLDKWKLTGEYRLVKVKDNKTLIAMAELEGIEKLFKILSKKYDKTLPVQPIHITLYTLPSDNFGIPINSYEELKNISKPISIPQIQAKL